MQEKIFLLHDFSCFVSPIILLPFLKWNKVKEYHYSALWLLILTFLVYSAEVFIVVMKKKIESIIIKSYTNDYYLH